MVAQLPVMLSLQPQSGAIEEEKQACVKVEVPAGGEGVGWWWFVSRDASTGLWIWMKKQWDS